MYLVDFIGCFFNSQTLFGRVHPAKKLLQVPDCKLNASFGRLRSHVDNCTRASGGQQLDRSGDGTSIAALGLLYPLLPEPGLSHSVPDFSSRTLTRGRLRPSVELPEHDGRDVQATGVLHEAVHQARRSLQVSGTGVGIEQKAHSGVFSCESLLRSR